MKKEKQSRLVPDNNTGQAGLPASPRQTSGFAPTGFRRRPNNLGLCRDETPGQDAGTGGCGTYKKKKQHNGWKAKAFLYMRNSSNNIKKWVFDERLGGWDAENRGRKRCFQTTEASNGSEIG